MGYGMRRDRQEKMQWLQRFRQMDDEIVSCREELQYWREKSSLLTSGYHELKVQGGRVLDLGDVAAKILDIETQLQYRLLRLTVLQEEIRGVIDAVEDPRFRIFLVLMRFFCGGRMLGAVS